MDAASEESAKPAKRLTRSISSNRVGARSRSGRRWSSSSDVEIETAAGGSTPTALLSRSYSAAAAPVVDEGGGAKQQARGEGTERRREGKLGASARLSRKIKEQRARFYIVRRCVSMLVCWRDADAAADY
ncbi:small polypeptide ROTUNDIFOLIA LIKE 3-like [Phragmites australis]|uniref:small polypeptide ROTUNDIFOLIA LIKE 3-like n=1 Tax=Phragmites australis TaxID=29695 RepID=UPI002D784F3A|nr:small polypeptide ROTUNDIFOLIA LIKE 3-like [Phragmites australis]